MEFAARLRSAEGQVMDMRTWISRVLHPRIPVIRLQDAPRDSSGRVMWTSVPPLQPVQPMALQPPCPSPTSHPSLPTKLEAGGQEVVTTQPVTPPAPVSPPCSRPLMAVPVCERVWGPWRSSPPHPGVHTWRRDSSEWAGKAVQLPPSSPRSLGHHWWMSSPVAAPSRQRANVQVSVCVACGKTMLCFLPYAVLLLYIVVHVPVLIMKRGFHAAVSGRFELQLQTGGSDQTSPKTPLFVVATCVSICRCPLPTVVKWLTS